MELIKVTDKKTVREFLQAAREVYRGDPNWVCPPDRTIESIFDPAVNDLFRDGEAARWILKSAKGDLIGRVAAFYNRGKASKYRFPVGGMGFFESVDDAEAAGKLFDVCSDWLEQKGMKAMDGPVNFGENVNFWGLLVEGFTPPAVGMNYHHPYYKKLFEGYGFKPFFEQETRIIDLSVPFPERFWKIAEWVIRKPGYRFEHFRWKHVEKFASDIAGIHNQAWVYHQHFTPLTARAVLENFRSLRSFIEEDFIWFVYYNGHPVAFFVMLPDINQILRSFNGKMGLIDGLRFYFMKRSGIVNRARITIMGVIPRFQGIGIESAIFWHLREPVLRKRPHYRELEISWVGDFNPKMRSLLEAMNPKPGKRHITYRKMFDESIPFERAAEIGGGRS